MDPTTQPTLAIRRGQEKEAPSSGKYVQPAASAQTRYMTVLSPRSTANPTEQDVQGVEASLPTQLSQHIPPQSSRYVRMLLQLDRMPRRYNLLASLFTRLLLAGYIVFPGTFTSLKGSNAVKNAANRDKTERLILDTVQNVPLLWTAAIFCVIGACGISCLWWRWNENFVWLKNRIFL
jgi:hypothetical protein